MWFIPKISQGVKDLANQMIENPHDWIQGDYGFVNKTHRDIVIWTINGKNYLKLNGNNAFNSTEKSYLNSAIKQSIANRLNNPKL